MESIRRRVDGFPFWQRRKMAGRPSTDERAILISFLLQQLFHTTFRDAEGLLHLLKSYYRIDKVPDHSSLCRAMSSLRRIYLLERFFKHVLETLPRRKAVIAIDATGYSGRKRGWRETPYAHRAWKEWLKVQAAIEVDEFLVLSYEFTESTVHWSQIFEAVWDGLPRNSFRSGA
jgi:hypothetical protein